MNYAALKRHDIANGPGVRVSLFVSGCRHHCLGCFNPETWSFTYGNPFTGEVLDKIIRACNHDFIAGLSVLGGEPLDPANQATVLRLLETFHRVYPHKTIWCYTGYRYDDELLAGSVGDLATVRQILSFVDVLVDGEFHEAEKDLKLRFRGSANQRLIRAKDSLAAGQLLLWDDGGTTTGGMAQ